MLDDVVLVAAICVEMVASLRFAESKGDPAARMQRDAMQEKVVLRYMMLRIRENERRCVTGIVRRHETRERYKELRETDRQ